ncbi:MAG TPA: hypothetical protein VG965_04650 [Patescibacteria group bacterium]|nr:hypothetical protein [Patescibacteria group bacterium]
MISVYIDTNCINARQDNTAINELEKLYHDDMLLIEKSDTLDTELSHGSGYPKGQKKSLDYIESYGPAVVGLSRVGSSIVGSEEDDKRLSKVLEILWGKKIRSAYSMQDMGDAMHITTAARYGGNYFVTNEKRLLKKSKEIKDEFGIEVCTPEDCLDKVLKRIKVLEENGHDPRQ